MTLTVISLDGGADFVYLYPPTKSRALGKEVTKVVLKLVRYKGQNDTASDEDIPDEIFHVSRVDKNGRTYVAVEPLVEAYGPGILSEHWYVYSVIPKQYSSKPKDMIDKAQADEVLEGYWVNEETMNHRYGTKKKHRFNRHAL
jgi:hypothetical protein